MTQCGETLDVLALESYRLNSSFQGLKFVWWWDWGDGEKRERFWND